MSQYSFPTSPRRRNEVHFWTVRLPRYNTSRPVPDFEYQYKGRYQTDKFYNERTPDQKTPSWFFSGCSREKAEQILTQYADHGNTLMRESTTHMKSGSYVISKRLFDKKTNDHAYEHYEVVRVAGGYKLNIQNEVRTKVHSKNPVRDEDPLEHRPMQCLTDVMEYFRETSGRDTRLLDTNDPYRMGPASDPQYQKQIKRSVDTEPWAWPPPDYEDPTDQAQGSNSRYPGMGAKTVSPGILKNPKSGNSRKTVDFTRNTISASSIRDHRHQTTIGDIEQRVHAAAHLKQLDAMIDSFETNNIYVNDEPMKQPDTDTVDASVLLRKQMPLPPTPHEHIAHDYMNTDLAALGVAPPPPRVPTVPNISGVDNMGAIPIPPPPPPPPPLLPCQQGPDPLSPTGQVQPSSKLQVIKAIAPPKPAPKPASSRQFTIGKTPASNRFDNSANGRLSNNPKSPNKIASVPAFNLGEDIAQQRLQLRKTQSVGTGLGSSKINPQSPDSMPTWDNKPKAAISPSGITSGANKTPQFNLTGPVKQEEETSGVDDSNPGGVQNLSQMFQNITQAKTKRANMPQRSGEQKAKVQANRKSAPVFPSPDGNKVTQVTVHGGPRPTIVESGERKSQLVNGPKVSPKPQTSTGFKPPSTEALSHRRQTDPGPITPQFQGLHDSFKRKLEGVIGGAPITGIPNQVEHEYEELPIIKPDSVTYANDFID